MLLVFLILIGMMINVMMIIKELLQIITIQIEFKFKKLMIMIINIKIIIKIVVKTIIMMEKPKILKFRKVKFSQIIVFNNLHHKVILKNNKKKNHV